MINQSLMQKHQPRGEMGPKTPDTADADRKAVEASPLLIGGAVGDGTTPSPYPR
jgi:hypothetical protein